jgi:hypothetical protein
MILCARVDLSLDATTTAPVTPPNPSGVCGQRSGCASTVNRRTIDLRFLPFHRIGDVGTSRAAQ